MGYLNWEDIQERNALEVQGSVGMPCKPPCPFIFLEKNLQPTNLIMVMLAMKRQPFGSPFLYYKNHPFTLNYIKKNIT